MVGRKLLSVCERRFPNSPPASIQRGPPPLPFRPRFDRCKLLLLLLLSDWRLSMQEPLACGEGPTGDCFRVTTPPRTLAVLHYYLDFHEPFADAPRSKDPIMWIISDLDTVDELSLIHI